MIPPASLRSDRDRDRVGISARDQIGITDRLRRNHQPSLAGAKATRRLKRRQGLCRVRQVSLEGSNLVEAELVPNSEDSTWVIATRDDLAPPGSRAASRKCHSLGASVPTTEAEREHRSRWGNSSHL